MYITDLSDIQISFDGYGYDAGADGRILARLHNPLPIEARMVESLRAFTIHFPSSFSVASTDLQMLFSLPL